MGKEQMEQLPELLYQHMQEMRFILLTTIKDQNTPFTNAISWTYAKSPEKIRFAVDSRSQIVSNINQNQGVALTIFFNETVYTIEGNAKLINNSIDGIPFKLGLIEVNVSEVHDVMYYGAKIVSELQIEKTYNEDAAKKLDIQVYDALKA